LDGKNYLLNLILKKKYFLKNIKILSNFFFYFSNREIENEKLKKYYSFFQKAIF